jgi:diketogulonate reductase-like aldo/keto reductase
MLFGGLLVAVVTRRSHVLASLPHVLAAFLSSTSSSTSTYQATAKTSTNLMMLASSGSLTTNSSLDSMPTVGLGTFLIPADQVDAALTSAVQMGYRRIDCAPVYFNEAAVGDALHRLVAVDKAVQRNDLFVTSKLASPFHRREHVRPALEKTLRDLRLDYLDLFLIHWPVAFRYVPIPPPDAARGWDNEDIDDSDGGNNIDPNVSVHETWQAMEECVDAGLVKHIGVSNFLVALLHELLSTSRIHPEVNQCEAHPYLPQHRLVEYCQQCGVCFQAYAPLGSAGYAGTLDSKEPHVLQDPTIVAIAQSRNVSPSQVCLAWAIQRNASVVVKSTNPEHQRDNWQQSHQLTLTAAEMERINSIPRRHRFFRPEDWWGSKGAVFD